MRSGMFPGQEAALRRRVQEIRDAERARGSRRAFLGVAVGGLVGTGAGVALGGTGNADAPDLAAPQAAAPAAEPDPGLSWVRKSAVGPLDRLLRSSGGLLTSVLQAPFVDDDLWVGVVRIANARLERDPRFQPGTERLLTLVANKAETPPAVRRCIALALSG